MAPRATTGHGIPQHFPSLRQIGYHATGLDPRADDFSYRSFNIGAVIYCKHHVTAQDPGADPLTNTNFVQVPKAIVCSKDRLGVVANVHQNGDIFILPSATRSGNDLISEDHFARDRSHGSPNRRHEFNDYAPTLPPRQQHRRRREQEYEPQDPFQIAERDFRARLEGLQTAQCEFDWHWGRINQAKNESPSEAGRREFKANNRLTRKLAEAWDRFREARHHCNDLGVEVPYDQQSSAFPTKPDDGEEKFRAWMVPFIGPEKHPWIEQWLDDVEEGRDSVSSQKRREKVAPPVPETDEWDDGSDVNAWDSQSTTAEGREKHRIKGHQAAQEIQREVALEHRRKVTASKRKRDVEQPGDGEERAAKARKRA